MAKRGVSQHLSTSEKSGLKGHLFKMKTNGVLIMKIIQIKVPESVIKRKTLE